MLRSSLFVYTIPLGSSRSQWLVNAGIGGRREHSHCYHLSCVVELCSIMPVYLRFLRYSDLKQLLLKVYIFTRFWGFRFIFGDHMLIG